MAKYELILSNQGSYEISFQYLLMSFVNEDPTPRKTKSAFVREKFNAELVGELFKDERLIFDSEEDAILFRMKYSHIGIESHGEVK